MYGDIDALQELILRLCSEKNITVNKLASLSNLTQSTVDSILKGKSRNPTIKTLQKISDGFKIDYGDFIKRLRSIEDEKNPNPPELLSSNIDPALVKAGRILWETRKSRNLSLYDVVKATGAQPEYESGSFGLNPLSTLIAIADYFDVSLDYLVGRSDNPAVNR